MTRYFRTDFKVEIGKAHYCTLALNEESKQDADSCICFPSLRSTFPISPSHTLPLTLDAQDAEDLAAGDGLGLGDTVGITEDHTNL